MTHDVSCIPNGHFCKKAILHYIHQSRGNYRDQSPPHWRNEPIVQDTLTLCSFIHTRKRPSNFTGIVSFRFSFRFWLISHSFFFAVWSVSLSCEQSENSHFFSLQSENKNPHIFACFRFKRIWAAHPIQRFNGLCAQLCFLMTFNCLICEEWCMYMKLQKCRYRNKQLTDE